MRGRGREEDHFVGGSPHLSAIDIASRSGYGEKKTA